MAFKQKSSPLNQFGSAISNAVGGAAQQGFGIQSAIEAASGFNPKYQNNPIQDALSQASSFRGNYATSKASSMFGKILGNSWKDNYWENKRKADFARGKAEVKAEIASRQNTAVTNTVDRAGMPIKADPNAIVQPPQPPPPVDITQNAAVTSNNDYNLRNMTSRQQTPISPKAFSNQGTIQNMYGQAMQGTFNRSVGSPFAQMADPLTGQYIDPTMDQSPDDPGPDPSLPQQPPVDVATPIAPVYDINNY